MGGIFFCEKKESSETMPEVLMRKSMASSQTEVDLSLSGVLTDDDSR